jgi:hypothetical protein
MQVEACSCPVTVVLLTTVRLSSSPCLVRWLALAFVRQGRVAAWWLAFAFVMQGMSAILLQASWFDQVWHHATVGQRPVPISLISRGGSRPVVSDLGMFLRCLNGLPLRCSVKLPIPCPSVQRPNPDPAKHPPPPHTTPCTDWRGKTSIRSGVGGPVLHLPSLAGSGGCWDRPGHPAGERSAYDYDYDCDCDYYYDCYY